MHVFTLLSFTVKSILGCVALYVLKKNNPNLFQDGQIVQKKILEKIEVMSKPLAFIEQNGPQVGIEKLPDQMFSNEYRSPAVNVRNLIPKLESIESLLNESGIDISFNLFVYEKGCVKNMVVSYEKTVNTQRITTNVLLLYRDSTNKPRHNNNTFSLVVENFNNKKAGR